MLSGWIFMVRFAGLRFLVGCFWFGFLIVFSGWVLVVFSGWVFGLGSGGASSLTMNLLAT